MKSIAPIASLLNRIFGNDRWRALLKPTKTPTDTTTVLPTTYQQDNKDIAVLPGQGFQNYQISAEKYFPFSNEKKFDDKTHVKKPVSPSHVRNESVYNPVNVELSTFVPAVSKYQDNFGNNGGNPSHQSLDSINGNSFPSQSMFSNEQTIPSNMGSQEKQTQYFGGNIKAPGSSDWFSSSSFDPDKVNSQAGLYDPNSAFKSFVTQTGSSKDNAQLSTSYDADAVNQRYMQTGGFQFPPGMTQSQTPKENQHPNDRYGSTSTFDADALNTMLMNKWSAPQSGNAQVGGNPQSRTQYQNGLNPFQNAQHVNHPQQQPGSGPSLTQQLTGNKETGKQHKQNGGKHQSYSAAKPPNAQDAKPRTQFSFIPGRLSSAGSSADSSSSQQYSRPSFLSSSKNSQTAPAFDPNALNAAQALYNPNAMSWLASGHKRQLPYEIEYDSALSNNSVSRILTNATNVKNKTSVYNGFNNTMSSIPNTVANTAYGGFDPNHINANHGQTSFVPGQITPHFYDGAGGDSFYGNNQGQSVGYINPPTQDFNPGSAVNFGVQSLLGISKMNTNSSRGSANGGPMGFSMSGFDPNSVNANFANMFGNDSNLGFGTTDNGGNSMYAGFGSFGSNDGKSNGSDPYQMYGYGMAFGNNGFDANAVNMPGYGAHTTSGGSNSSSGGPSGTSFGGFGAFPAMNGGGGYGAAIYDANQVNQQLIQTPFEGQSSNSTGNGMYYFLGINKGGQTFGADSSYQSSFISAFDPSTVNQAVYDPNKYNNVHINFDPLEMLSKNPGMDKATLQSASFDPDKANSAYTQINFSPAGMIANRLGLNATVANGATFDPSTAGQASFVPSQMGTPYSQAYSNRSSSIQPVFDPVEIMRQLMKDSSMFVPGSSGSQQIKFDPSAVFQQGSNPGLSTTPIVQQHVTTTQMPTYTTTMRTKASTTVPPTSKSPRPSTKASLTTMFTTVSSLIANTTSP